ncbi:MAG: DUF3108 domain-containing protein [Bacteroidetes bacterium]|nr:DUF3108 domain-containing protein [Bacteroidota bacterium]
MYFKKYQIIISLLFVFSAKLLLSQDTVNNKAFKVGEQLKYRVYYSSSLGNFTAGEAVLTVENWKGTGVGRAKDVYHITGEGNSKGMFNWFYKVRDKFETFTDKQTLLPYAFIRKTREGKYKQDDRVIFDREKGEAVTNSKKITKIPPDVHDFVSALYFMRTISIEDFDADSMYYINFFLDDSVYTSAVKYQGKSDLITKWGTITCLKIAPMMASGEVFAEKYPMFVYVTDDESHVPILAESAVIVGSVKMELIEQSNLTTPLESKEKRNKHIIENTKANNPSER